MNTRVETLIPVVGVITDVRIDTPDVKTFRVVTPDGKKAFEYYTISSEAPKFTLCPWSKYNLAKYLVDDLIYNKNVYIAAFNTIFESF